MMRTRDPDYEECNIPLAIYGTLMEGQSNHPVMQELAKKDHARLIDADCNIANSCIVQMGGLPSLYPTRIESLSRSKAELWHISSSALDRLDIFEGHPSFYSRMDMTVIDSSGRANLTIVYRGPALQIEAVRVFSRLIEDGTMNQSDWADMEEGGVITADMATSVAVQMPRPPNAPPLDDVTTGGVRYRIRPSLSGYFNAGTTAINPFGDGNAPEEVPEEDEEEVYDSEF